MVSHAVHNARRYPHPPSLMFASPRKNGDRHSAIRRLVNHYPQPRASLRTTMQNRRRRKSHKAAKGNVEAILTTAAICFGLIISLSVVNGLISFFSTHPLELFGLIAAVFVAACIFMYLILPIIVKRRLSKQREILGVLAATIKSMSKGHPGYDLSTFTQSSNYLAIKDSLSWKVLECVALKSVEPHLKALSRKRSQLVYTDEYGRENNSKWKKELEYFVGEVMLPVGTAGLSQQALNLLEGGYESFLSESSDKSVKLHWINWLEGITAESQPVARVHGDMTGHEYEHYVAEIIRNDGWDASVTKGSGDHGADIIATQGGVRLVVQCKQYSSAVGNKSVQEAYSAKGFYECHCACVVTNSSFTPAAKQAARKLGVRLLHHDDLSDYLVELETDRLSLDY